MFDVPPNSKVSQCLTMHAMLRLGEDALSSLLPCRPFWASLEKWPKGFFLHLQIYGALEVTAQKHATLMRGREGMGREPKYALMKPFFSGLMESSFELPPPPPPLCTGIMKQILRPLQRRGSATSGRWPSPSWRTCSRGLWARRPAQGPHRWNARLKGLAPAE